MEDIARFDMAMTVEAADVDSRTINSRREEVRPMRHSKEAHREMLRWVWTRKREEVIFSEGTVPLILEQAIEIGSRYVDTPPLVQGANVRLKIARVAAAIAARLFSTDESFSKVVVEKRHVMSAIKFLDMLYSKPSFGYASLSRERLRHVAKMEESIDDIMHWITTYEGMARFLKDSAGFKKKDLVDHLNVTPDSVQAVMHELIQRRVVYRRGGTYYPESAVIRQLRNYEDKS